MEIRLSDDTKIKLGPRDPESGRGYCGGTLEPGSNFLVDDDDPEELKIAMDALQALVLAHAVAGIDVASPAYEEGIETVVMKLYDEWAL